MKVVVFYSGGIGSWYAAKCAVDMYGADDVKLLFTDTLIEDEDLYRFLREGADALGSELITIADGRTPWQVFRDVRYVGNSRVDPCSRVLKRDLAAKWIKDNTDEAVTLYFGIDWTEQHRLAPVVRNWAPRKVVAPMCDRLEGKDVAIAALSEYNIAPPRLYALGFPHNNCGGFCVKTGQAQFKLLYETMPERYIWHEQEQEVTSRYIGKSHGFIRMRRDGEMNYLTLRDFRRILTEDSGCVDKYDFGGCGCFMEDTPEPQTNDTKEVNMSNTVGQLIKIYRDAKAEKDRLNAENKKQVAELDSVMDQVKTKLTAYMNQQETDKLSSDDGKAFFQEKTYVGCEDFDLYIRTVIAKALPGASPTELKVATSAVTDAITKSPRKESVVAWESDTGSPPPGIKITREKELQIRK